MPVPKVSVLERVDCTYLPVNKHSGVENIGNDLRLKPFLIVSQILLITTMAYE